MIKIGIVGYGNLGKGIEKAISKNVDMNLVAVFSRRPKGSFSTLSNAPVYEMSDITNFTDTIDLLILCGGSATDLPEQGPYLASMFNTVDSFDTHANIFDYYNKMNEVAKNSNKLSLISCGWDPGLFSLARCLFSSILPDGKDYTFWGKGVSQGHSDAIRRIPGVIDARQYTIPIESSIEAARSSERPNLTTRQKHKRDCYVVAQDGADLKSIEESIISMPNYFSDYDTTVNFISIEELNKNHNTLPHGGFVIRNGETSDNNNQVVELSLKLDSNPEFTSSILVAYARAVYRMANEGKSGAISVLDIPFSYLSQTSKEDLLKSIV